MTHVSSEFKSLNKLLDFLRENWAKHGPFLEKSFSTRTNDELVFSDFSRTLTIFDY
jgi:hypothetical protein